jgi:hypothetical protein
MELLTPFNFSGESVPIYRESLEWGLGSSISSVCQAKIKYACKLKIILIKF